MLTCTAETGLKDEREGIDMSADDTNRSGGWLDRGRTEGDASAFLPGGGSRGIEVSPDGVKVFASQANGEAEDFQRSSTEGMLSLQSEAGTIGRSFLEAEAFNLQHDAGLEALGLFTTDAGKGLMALGAGAASIAITYINGDTTSAATLKDVQDAFDVSGGRGMFNRPTPEGNPDQASTGGNTLNGGAPGRDDHANIYDPHAAKDIRTGEGTYTVPADAPDDLERLDPSEIRETTEKWRDDLGKTEG